MLSRLKKTIRDRYEKQMRTMLLTMCKESEVETNTHEFFVPCDNPWHEHKVYMTEIVNPPGMENIFLNVQTNWQGKRVIVQKILAHSMESLSSEPIEDLAVAGVRRSNIKELFQALIDEVAVNWIANSNR